MKLQIILALALLSVSVSGFGLNIDQFIATKGPGVVDSNDLRFIIQSQYNQYRVVTNFFKPALATGGKLDLTGFSLAYGGFFKWLVGKDIPFTFIYARFQLADYANQNGAIDLSEFTFLVITDLRFVYDNYCLFDGGLGRLKGTLQTLESFFEGEDRSEETDWLFNGAFFGFDFDKNSQISPVEFRSGMRILGYILGVNLSFISPILNDLFWLADVNDDLALTSEETYNFIYGFVTDYKVMFQALLSST